MTILLGANDLCTSSVSTMTSTTTFRAQFGQAMATLLGQNQDRYVFVSSIPNLYQLWQVLHSNSTARWVWTNFHIYHYQFSASQVSTLDFFHPSLSGQAALARVTWAASWWG